MADEAEDQLSIKNYDLEGSFTGQELGKGIFQYKPEGITLYACGTAVATGSRRISTTMGMPSTCSTAKASSTSVYSAAT